MRLVGLLILVAALGGCSKSGPRVAEDLAMMDVKEPSAPAEKAAGAPIPVSGPRIAYSYTYGYRLGSGEIDAVQAKHVALCDKLGPQRCHIGEMQKSSANGEFSNASLTLFVDARIARAFGGELDKVAAASGGEASDRGIEAEDLSKQMVDTQARINAKQALADRLMTLIKTGGGKVGDLVEAEKAFSDAQEQLDAARSNMAEMQGRVSMSQIKISYAARNAEGGFLRPVQEAFASGGRTMGASLGALVTFVIVIAPWFLLLAGLLWLKRRLRWSTGVRWPWRRRADVTP